MAYTQPVITSDAGTFSPYLRLNATQSINSRNVVHELIGGGVAVTFGGTTEDVTTLEMLFTSEADSLTAYDQLNAGHVFELVDYSKTSTSMFFVVAGTVSREYLTETEDTWQISVDVQEVTP
jgi:hypothetical protein